jgi:hypothetical protein
MMFSMIIAPPPADDDDQPRHKKGSGGSGSHKKGKGKWLGRPSVFSHSMRHCPLQFKGMYMRSGLQGQLWQRNTSLQRLIVPYPRRRLLSHMPCARGLPAPWQTSVHQLPSLSQPQCMLLSNLGFPLKTSVQMPLAQRTSVCTEGR